MCQYFFFADVFKSDIWTEFFASIPVHLLPLASVVRLCVFTLEVSSRDGEDGLRSTSFATVPVNTFQSALYRHCRLNVASCPSPLLNELFSIDWAQNLASLPTISDHSLVSSMISAAQRILGRPRDKKDPVTPDMLKALTESKIKDKSPSLSDLRTVATFTVLLQRAFLAGS